MRFKRSEYQSELDHATKLYEDRRTLLRAKTRKWIWGAWAYTTVQLAVGTYAIYGVEWIGWDLVEPVTYTLSQGGFIACMCFMMRASRLNSSDYGDFMDRAVSKKLDLSKWAEEEGGLISDDRVKLLTKELETIDE